MSGLPEPEHGRAADEISAELGAGTPPLSPLHDLLAAIIETLTIPQAAHRRDEPTAHRLLVDRAAQLRGYLRGMVQGRDEPDIHADGIRDLTAELPVTYTPWVNPDASSGRLT